MTENANVIRETVDYHFGYDAYMMRWDAWAPSRDLCLCVQQIVPVGMVDDVEELARKPALIKLKRELSRRGLSAKDLGVLPRPVSDVEVNYLPLDTA